MDSGWAAILGGLVVGMIGITGTIISNRYASAREAAKFRREYLQKKIDRLREYFGLIDELCSITKEDVVDITADQHMKHRAVMSRASIDTDDKFDEELSDLIPEDAKPWDLDRDKILIFLRGKLRRLEDELLQ